MIKHVLIGVFAAFVAIVIVAVAQPEEPPAIAFDPKVIRIDDIESFIPKAEKLRRPPATRPAHPLDQVVKEVSFENAPLADALEFLRDVTGANLLVNWRALEAAGIERTTPVTVKLRDVTADAALAATLDSAGGGTVPLRHRYQKGIFHISTAEELAYDTEIRLYNVRDLLIEAMRFHRSFDHAATADFPATRPAAPEPPWTEDALSANLRDLIIQSIHPDSWMDNGGRNGVCFYWAGKLLILQTPEAHDEIERLLNMLREE